MTRPRRRVRPKFRPQYGRNLALTVRLTGGGPPPTRLPRSTLTLRPHVGRKVSFATPLVNEGAQ